MTTKFVPAEPIPPGEIVQDEMNARGWTQDDLAEVLGMSRRQVANIVGGKCGITPETAHLLAQAFDHDAKSWMNLQVAYELAMAASDDRSVARRAELYERYPVREIIRRGWILKPKDASGLNESLCKFLRISRANEWPDIRHAARKGVPYSSEPSGAELAWCCRVRQLAEAVSVNRYSDRSFERILVNLRDLAENREDVRRVPAVLAKGGIRFVIVKHLKSTKLDGATIWLDENSPVIAMTLRYDRIDNFWHTLIHEMDHVQHRDHSIDSNICEVDDATMPQEERRANEAAAHHLVPSDALGSFIVRHGPLYYQHRVVAFAKRHGIHPGIVVGQLQKKRELDWNQLRKLLEKVRSDLIGQAITDGWGNSLQL